MCRVTWPWGEHPALWGGVYGNAIVVAGDKAEAITADGKRHPL